MLTSRLHFARAFDWAIAVAFLGATLAVGLLILNEFRALHDTAPAAASAPAVLPAAAPAFAVSVPALSLGGGVEIRVGQTYDEVAAAIGDAAEIGRPVIDQGSLGPRTTRFYRRAGTGFVVVFEPFERGGVPRAGAIYIQ